MHLFGNLGERPKVSYRDAIERKNFTPPVAVEEDEEPE